MTWHSNLSIILLLILYMVVNHYLLLERIYFCIKRQNFSYIKKVSHLANLKKKYILKGKKNPIHEKYLHLTLDS